MWQSRIVKFNADYFRHSIASGIKCALAKKAYWACPPNEEEGLHQLLSTPVTNSHLLNSLQPLSSTRSPTVSSKRNQCRMDASKGKCRLVYTLDLEHQDTNMDTTVLLSQIQRSNSLQTHYASACRGHLLTSLSIIMFSKTFAPPPGSIWRTITSQLIDVRRIDVNAKILFLPYLNNTYRGYLLNNIWYIVLFFSWRNGKPQLSLLRTLLRTSS